MTKHPSSDSSGAAGEACEAPALIPLRRAAALLSCCRQTLYRMHDAGEIRFVKLLSRTMVPRSEIERIAAGAGKPEPVGEPVGEPRKTRVKKRKLYPQLTDATWRTQEAPHARRHLSLVVRNP